MPVDTVAITSRDVVSWAEAECILEHGIGHFKEDNSDGTTLFERHQIRVPGSWDSRCNVSMVPAYSEEEEDLKAHQEKGYRVRIEGSAAKLVQGHNVTGGPGTLSEAVEVLTGLATEVTGYDFAQHKWNLNRLDWAENFVFDSREQVEHVVRNLTKIRMARKNNRPYEGESIECAGVSWTWKGYWKGPEFQVHDRPRLQRAERRDLGWLIDLAWRTVRLEAEYKVPWLKYHRDTRKIEKLPENWQDEWEKTTMKVLQGDINLNRTCDPLEVRYRLAKRFSQAQAAALWGTWSDIIMNGEAVAKAAFQGRERTWYDHKRKLKDAGIAMFGVTCQVEDRICDFSLSSPHRAKDAWEVVAA